LIHLDPDARGHSGGIVIRLVIRQRGLHELRSWRGGLGGLCLWPSGDGSKMFPALHGVPPFIQTRRVGGEDAGRLLRAVPQGA